MSIKTILPAPVLVLLLIGITLPVRSAETAAIEGVVKGPNGPEAGVWMKFQIRPDPLAK